MQETETTRANPQDMPTPATPAIQPLKVYGISIPSPSSPKSSSSTKETLPPSDASHLLGLQDFNETLALAGVHGYEIDAAFKESTFEFAPWLSKERTKRKGGVILDETKKRTNEQMLS